MGRTDAHAPGHLSRQRSLDRLEDALWLLDAGTHPEGVAERVGMCVTCGGLFRPGDHIWPAMTVNSQIRWAHERCPAAKGTEHARPMCRGCWRELPLGGKCGECAA